MPVGRAEQSAARDRSCALVVVGNEVLSGKIQDSNSYFAARELRRLGVALRRIAVVPDELDAIAEEAAYSAARYDVVLTSGGVGPTHDDVTIEGVARAFNRKVVRHPELERLIRERVRGDVNPARLKMAEVPEGAILNPAANAGFPTVQVENVYVLPGIPQLFEAKLMALTEKLRAAPYYQRTIYTQAGESAVAAHLNACLEKFPELMLGSYPKLDSADYRVKLTLESKDRAYLERAFDHLLKSLPAGTVARTE